MDADDLPVGWAVTELENIAKWGAGGTPSRKNASYYGGDIPWVKTGDLGPRILREASEYITDEGLKNSSAKVFPKGSVAIAMYGATIGKTSIFDIDAATNQACAVAAAESGVAKDFLYYLLNNEKENFINKGKGGAQPNISQTIIKAHMVVLPPSNEQTRIANKLDELLAQVDTIKARVDAIPGILKRFRQSVLAAAVSGRLTEEWRESKEYERYPKSWARKGFSEIGDLARGKSKHRPRNDPRLFGKEYPFIQTGEVANSGGVISSATKYYSEFGLQQSRLFPAGTLCITIAANIADTALLGIEACFPDSVVGFTPDTSECVVEFVKYLVDVNKETLEQFAPATAQKNINLKVLNEMKFPLPPVEEQLEIVKAAKILLGYADQVENCVEGAMHRVDSLTHSILAKAFRGELVPQDSDDEPASELLTRIEKEREEAKRAKNPIKKPTKNDFTTGLGKKMNKTNLKEWLIGFQEKEFSYETLEQVFDGATDHIESVIFKLLEEKRPIIEQTFDSKTGNVIFKKIQQ